MTIRAKCPKCGWMLEAYERPRLYTCRKCGQKARIKGEAERSVAYFLDLADKFLEATR